MKKEVIFEASSDFGTYRVVDGIYEGRQARVLYGGGDSPQSGIALDADPELLFDYNQRFLEIAESIRPQSVLVLGGGVFTLPLALLERFDDIAIDAVEIDPLLTQIAHNHFGLQKDRRLTIINNDARQYIDETNKKYDLIVIDAFSKYDIPRSLLTVEACGQYAQHLNNDGVVAFNFIARYHTYRKTLTHRLQAAFKKVFKQVDLYPADPHYNKRAEQNILLVATNSSTSLDYLQSSPVELLTLSDDAELFDRLSI